MNRYLESTEFYHRRYQNFSTLIIIPMLILFILILIFISIGKVNANTKSIGEVINTRKVITLVNSNDINSIKNNQTIYFIIKNNKNKNISIPGKVIHSAKSPSIDKNGLNYYKITNKLYPSKGNKKNLRRGLNGSITIIKERTTILQNIINNIRK